MASIGAVEQPYLAMEYVPGRPLDAYAAEHRPGVDAKLELLARICEAVHHAHVKGIIHRDLKPGNILVIPLRESDSGSRELDGQPKVLDFGVARVVGDEQALRTLQTQEGQVLGTIPFMSPEQFTADPQQVDARSDVYALGVIAFHLLTGSLPYASELRSLAAAARTICEEPALRLGTLDRTLRGDVELIVAKALEKDPAQRYQSAAELAGDVRRYLRGEPITARPPSAVYQLSRLARRHKAAVAVSAVSVVALLALTVVSLRQAHVAIQQRAAAERRLEYAREPVEYLLSGVRAQLSRVPGTETVQRHLAEESYRYHKQVADETPDDPVQYRGVWRALLTLSTYEANAGNQERSERLFQEADRLIRAAATAAPYGRVAQSEWAMHLTRLAVRAERAGDLPAAHACWSEAVAVAHAGLERWPDDVYTLRAAAEAEGGLARLKESEEAAPDAERLYHSALDRYERLLRIDPNVDAVYATDLSEYAPGATAVIRHLGSRPVYEYEIATLQLALAHLAESRGDRSVAAEWRQRVLATVEERMAEGQKSPRLLDVAARAHRAQRDGLVRSGEHAAAAVHAQRTCALMQDRVDAGEQSVPTNIALARDYLAWNEISLSLGDMDTATQAGSASLSWWRRVAADPQATPGQLVEFADLLLAVRPESLRDQAEAKALALRAAALPASDPARCRRILAGVSPGEAASAAGIRP